VLGNEPLDEADFQACINGKTDVAVIRDAGRDRVGVRVRLTLARGNGCERIEDLDRIAQIGAIKRYIQRRLRREFVRRAQLVLGRMLGLFARAALANEDVVSIERELRIRELIALVEQRCPKAGPEREAHGGLRIRGVDCAEASIDVRAEGRIARREDAAVEPQFRRRRKAAVDAKKTTKFSRRFERSRKATQRAEYRTCCRGNREIRRFCRPHPSGVQRANAEDESTQLRA
jgi:hypothetical protein